MSKNSPLTTEENEISVLGRLDILVRPERDASDTNDVWLEIALKGPDWKSLYYDFLGCPKFDFTKSTEENRLAFEVSLQKYPMLARIFDMYDDYLYTSGEVKALRLESLELIEMAHPEAANALDKIIKVCDEALKMKGSLLFASD